MILKVKKLSPDAVIPTRAYPGDAGFDLVAAKIENFSEDDDGYEIMVRVFFGISVEIPDGYVGLIFPRSSICKSSFRLSNCVGVIDSGYRGELSAVFDVYPGSSFYEYCAGDKCAQLVILKLPEVELVEADELTPSVRGSGSYGSSDRKGGQA